MKVCSKCNKQKELTDFYYNASCKDRKRPECKECTKVFSKKYCNSETGKLVRSEYNKVWSKCNSHIKNATSRARQVQKYKAIPKWADLEKIKSFYKLAKDLEKHTGVKYEVDHIVPIQSSLVCGLHCESNLRVIPQLENRIKGNMAWPGCPN